LVRAPWQWTTDVGDAFCRAERRGPQRGSRVGVAILCLRHRCSRSPTSECTCVAWNSRPKGRHYACGRPWWEGAARRSIRL